jgi:hypothetical protein
MSRYDTFDYDDLSKRQEMNIRAIAAASKSSVDALIKVAETAVRRANKRYLEGVVPVYELSAKAMCNRLVRNELRLRMSDLKEWKTSAKLNNCLARHILGVSRQMASKYSAVFMYAYARNVKPEDFLLFVKKQGGIEKIYGLSLEARRKERGSDQDQTPTNRAKIKPAKKGKAEAATDPEGVSREPPDKRAKAKAENRTDKMSSASTKTDRAILGIAKLLAETERERLDPEPKKILESHFETEKWLPALLEYLKGGVREAKRDGARKLGTVIFKITPQGNMVMRIKALRGIKPKTT